MASRAARMGRREDAAAAGLAEIGAGQAVALPRSGLGETDRHVDRDQIRRGVAVQEIAEAPRRSGGRGVRQGG